MDFQHLFLNPTTLLAILALLSYVVLKRLSNVKRPPEAAGGWPVIGHLCLVRNHPQMALGALSDKYGPIFTFRFCLQKYLVVNSRDIVMELLKTHDVAISGRLSPTSSKILGYGNDNFGLCPYNAFWRQMRKVAATELLSNRKLEMLKPIKAIVVEDSVKELYRLWRTNKSEESSQMSLEMKKWLADLNMNLMVRIVAGKRCVGNDEEGRRLCTTLKEFFRLSGKYTVGDALPFLRWADIGGHEKAMKKAAEDMDQLLEEWLEEHRRRRKTGERVGDFIDALLPALEGLDLYGHDLDSVIKATSSTLLTGGSEAIVLAETWTLALLLNNPEVLQKAQQELDQHVGRERLVTESDINNMVYLQAIVKESLRLHPPAPMIPRAFAEACTVGGYYVPKGTKLLLNIWRIQTDPSIWSDPLEFKPERFLGRHIDVDVKGQHFELLPFGGGRRMCPGAVIAVQMTQLLVATFLQAFELSRSTSAPVDVMRENGGFNNVMAAPLEILIKPRLPHSLYQ